MNFTTGLTRFFSILTFLFLVGITAAAILEDYGIGRQWIGYFFIFTTLGAYALIGLLSRTSDLSEYFVAAREVPAVYNGMATAADWMSAASFLGVAGTLYYGGYNALALIVGWTGGFVMIALLVAPYLRKFDLYSVADFLALRYPGKDEGRVVRTASVVVTISISFVYVVAQIYAVGLITSRFAGVEFGIGVFFGLAGILVCSFLGGMRAVTWTQVAQYLVMIVAMVVTMGALWGVAKQGQERIGISASLGLSEYIQNREAAIALDSKEAEVRQQYKEQANEYAGLIERLPASWAEGYESRRRNLEVTRYDKNATFQDIKEAERTLNEYPKNAKEAKQVWKAKQAALISRVNAGQLHFGVNNYLGKWLADKNALEFIATVVTLMCGTVALPHIIMRFFTTPNASQTRWSVAYALGFILVLYLIAPWVATLMKVVVYEKLVGISFADLPNWVAAWAKVDTDLALLKDINQDGVIQYAEIGFSSDILVLITPEIAGLPFFLSGLIAVGGLAAALSTADGLLLTIANSFSHDVYYRMFAPNATAQKRVTMSKIALLTVALLAAWFTSLQPGNIVYLVGAAFALAGSALFVPLVAGVFWSGATRRGAVWSMAVGFGSSVLYLSASNNTVMGFFGLEAVEHLPVAAVGSGLLTIPLSALAMYFGSLRTAEIEASEIVTQLRQPESSPPKRLMG